MLNTLRAVCAEPYGFWLDSALPDERSGTRSFWGADPAVILRSDRSGIEVEWKHRGLQRLSGDPFDILRSLLEERAGKGVAVGYLGYGLKRHVERLSDRAVDDLGVPECHIAFYDRIYTIDPRSIAPSPPVLGLPPAFHGLRSTFAREAYEAAVRCALAHIRAGDVYQINLSQRFETPCVRDEFDTYLRLRAQAPAPFAAFLRYPGYVVMSCSPERFLRYEPAHRLVETRPIKGTRPRGPGPRSDRALAQELLSSAKDRAENVMIVDLERNDLGRVAEIGSVRVDGLCELESFPTVHHLTSTVRARLRPDRDVVDLLRATFPGGSVTGAPKIRAMELIDEIEPVARGVYTGAIGYIEPGGTMDLNIAIRTVIARDGMAWFHVGGGIVADSDPAQEYEETLHKGAALARALLGEGP